jgi:hypothetical protein
MAEKKSATTRDEPRTRIHGRDIPLRSREVYQKAMTGKSRKAAVHAFCLECCGWQINEVFQCTDSGCPLYPYRPASRIVADAHERPPDDAESTDSPQMEFDYL